MNWKLFSFFIAGCLLITLVAFVSNKAGKSDFDAAKEIIVMRQIAHQVLQYTGDSTSQVLPVNQLSSDEFLIPFSTSFSFKPDSLVRIIDQVIARGNLSSNYIVNVLECGTDKVIFGYAVLSSHQNSIVPCLGRDQPVRPYCINIKFRDNGSPISNSFYVATISLLAVSLFFLGFYRLKKRKYTNKIKEDEQGLFDKAVIAIGKYQFYPEQQCLIFNDGKIVLTVKESQLLSIFAASPNQIIDRNRLQRIWEDDGVIVGRSLDVFISRLRKKLENDPNVKLVNIHGKGYNLEIDG